MLNTYDEAVYYRLTPSGPFATLAANLPPSPRPDNQLNFVLVSFSNERIPRMKTRLVGLVILLCAGGLLLFSAGSDRGQSKANGSSSNSGLSQPEQDLMNEINQARAHPQVYASYLEKLKPLFKGNVYKPAG